jgi:hypothetical protein
MAILTRHLQLPLLRRPICTGGSSRLIGARAAPSKCRQQKPTLAAAIKAADRRETGARDYHP